MRVKQSVKDNFLLLLLSCIERKMGLSLICKTLGKTKQALNHHLKRYGGLGLIKRISSYPFAIYELTPMGKAVKHNLTQSEPNKSIWKAHNLILGFNIKSFGRFEFVDTSIRKIIHMNNWIYAREDKGDFIVNIQETGLLKVYCPAMYTEEPDIAFGQMYAEVNKIAQEYCDKYGMKLIEPIKTIRRGEKSLLKSENLAKIFGRQKIGSFWIDASDGKEELEEPQDSYGIEDLLKMPFKVDHLEKVIVEELSPTLKGLKQHWDVHLPLMQSTEETQQAMRHTLSEINSTLALIQETLKAIGDYFANK